MTPSLTSRQRKHLRGLAHALKPVIHVGAAGASDSLLAELEGALAEHELVKVRLLAPEDKKALAAALVEASGAELCGLVGHTAILYRRHPEKPRIQLPG